MAKKPVGKHERGSRRAASGASTTGRPAAASGLPLVAGAAFLGLSALMSLLLVLEHLGGLSLPGCGEGGACEQAANSVWGKVKLGRFEWPVSYLGLAYFLGALVAWIAARAVVPQVFRQLVRLGALVSLGFCVIIILERTFCLYCIAAHIGNFAFWLTMELTRARPVGPRLAVASVGTAFALVTAALGVWDVQHRATVREKAEQQRIAAARQIIEYSRQQQSAPLASPIAQDATTRGPSGPTATASPPARQGPAEQPAATEPLFTGRYRVGPAQAPIRIVMFTDYQCRDCYNIEKQLKKLHETRSDISISIKHFPFNSDCNPCISKTVHRNACWAARAAEAAGVLWGPEGFWKMHGWLFERRGVFRSTRELDEGVRELGYDPTGFAQVMSSEETLRAIRADAEEAKKLGLHFTPMIFINGVELKGWIAPRALIRTVEQVAATNPPARSAAFDRPPLAFEKYVADWREQPQLVLPPDKQAWILGPETTSIKIVLWGDYQESGTTTADAIIRAFAAGRSDVQYAYRHYPFNSDCNPSLKDRRHPHACRAALAAEAAGRLAGNDGFWKMHVWLMENRQRFSDDALRAAATEMGFDASALLAAIEQDDLQANILDDIRAGKRLPRLRHGTPRGIYGVPTIFVNGRYVPRWRVDGQPVLSGILVEAAED